MDRMLPPCKGQKIIIFIWFWWCIRCYTRHISKNRSLHFCTIMRTEIQTDNSTFTIRGCSLMQIERISADITLKHKPRTGTQAYNMLIESLNAEIQEKQEILSHFTQDKVKQKFIENWNPTTRSVNIYDM